MQDAATGADDGLGAIVSNLISLVDHVQNSLGLINSALARETGRGDIDAADVIVLDDVTPQYLKARHALLTCSASLNTALQSLLDARAPSRPSCHKVFSAPQKA
jgi:hypothetical protein